MIRVIKAVSLYFIFWVLFFITARVIFVLFQADEVIKYSFSDILNAFYHGLKMDLSASGYLLLLPVLFAIPHFFTGGRWYRTSLKIYTAVLVFVFTPLILGDAFVYRFWAFRLDATIIGYLKNPKDALASATTFQLILGAFAWIVVSFAVIRTFFRLADRIIPDDKPAHPYLSSATFVLIFGLLIIPIRGGFGVAPMNNGSVYFSNHLFLNHSAVNVVWNFGFTAAHRKPSVNPYMFSPSEKAAGDFASLMSDSGTTKKVLSISRPNILLVIVESFGSEIINLPGTDSAVAPRFKEYLKEGIYFSNLFASGSRTDKAIPAILAGYPNLPTIQVIMEPRKTQSMPGIFRMLDSAGYATSFWYGGDINFANMNSFITYTGFRQKITMEDFSKKDRNSKWGVHDHVVLNRLLDPLNSARRPFAAAVLTLSSHEPFEVPVEPVFTGKDILSKFRNSVHYTDKSLGEFLDRARETDWWDSTLVIITADHCRRNADTIPAYAESIFRIPMLWTGGAISVKDTIITGTFSQTDLVTTLARQLDLNSSFRFSKNMFSDKSGHFAFYTYNEGFAFITDTSAAMYDIRLKDIVTERGPGTKQSVQFGKSFLQVLFDDYLSR